MEVAQLPAGDRYPAGAVKLQFDYAGHGTGAQKICLNYGPAVPPPSPPPPPPAPPPPPHYSRPPIANMGSVDVGNICEQTPVLVDGEMWRFESVHPLYHGNPSWHGDPTKPGKSYQRFVNVKTGAVTPAFGSGYALGSAFVDAETGTVFSYGTHCGENDACGAPTSNRHIRVWWSTDKMQTWQSAVAISVDGKKFTLWNTSVDRCKINGTAMFVMAFETDDPATPGGWNTMFATAPSPRGPWTIMDIDRYRMPLNVEHADPTIRFIPDSNQTAVAAVAETSSAKTTGGATAVGSGWFYVMTGRASLSTACTDSAGRYFMEIYRSRDLLSWEPAAGMGTPSLIDGMLMPNATLDRQPASEAQSPAEHAYMEETQNTTDTWTDCNASDMDLCELDGKTYLFWTWGHQSHFGGLVLGVSPMPLAQFLAAFY